MNAIQYCLATSADVQNLVGARIAFLTKLTGQQPIELTKTLKQQLEQYFRSSIENKAYIGWLAKSEDRIVGWGGMNIRTHPGSFKNPSGRMGYIMNMYTLPGFRRQGIGSELLNKLLDTGREMGIRAFELHATKEGEPVYRKGGFEKHSEPTYRKYY